MHRFSLFVLGLLSLGQTALAAGPDAPAHLALWRSYTGVTWQQRVDAHSVNAPIAGLHFDAAGRAFVSTPRLISTQAPATLSLLDTKSLSGPARLTAFPSTAANSISADPRTHLRNVLGFYVDNRNGWLWALDQGFVAGEKTAPPGAQKIMIYALSDGHLVQRIPLDSVADREGSFLNDIVVDEARRVAYIADSGLRSAPDNQAGLIVADANRGTVRRVLNQHPALMPVAGLQVVSHGETVWPGNPIMLGINGIALSPDQETLYWTVTTGTTARTIATAALFAQGTTTLRNIYNWRVKETDRLFAMATELRKVGAEVEEGEDYIRITPPAKLKYAEIGTYNDHRMAMCFSLVALSDTPVTILDPKCTAKTFPDYFEQLARISTLA